VPRRERDSPDSRKEEEKSGKKPKGEAGKKWHSLRERMGTTE